jgi:hypothetical protein
MSQETGDRELAEQLTKAFRDLDETLRTQLQEIHKNNNTQTMTLDTGSRSMWFAVWLATLCCVVMFLQGQADRDKLASMQVQLIDTSRKLDVAQDKLSIVLQWAPNLREEVNKEMKDKGERPSAP